MTPINPDGQQGPFEKVFIGNPGQIVQKTFEAGRKFIVECGDTKCDLDAGSTNTCIFKMVKRKDGSDCPCGQTKCCKHGSACTDNDKVLKPTAKLIYWFPLG